jgi:hypothetical protein
MAEDLDPNDILHPVNLRDWIKRTDEAIEEDHKKIAQIHKELEMLITAFQHFRTMSLESLNLLTWAIDMVRIAALQAAKGDLKAATEADKKAYDQLQDLRKLLGL